MAAGGTIEDYPDDKKVTYYVEFNRRLFVLENVPARVRVETGENHFSPEAAERLQWIVHEQRRPVHPLQTPVYEFVR